MKTSKGHSETRVITGNELCGYIHGSLRNRRLFVPWIPIFGGSQVRFSERDTADTTITSTEHESDHYGLTLFEVKLRIARKPWADWASPSFAESKSRTLVDNEMVDYRGYHLHKTRNLMSDAFAGVALFSRQTDTLNRREYE